MAWSVVSVAEGAPQAVEAHPNAAAKATTASGMTANSEIDLFILENML
jgi:hypothetical protein